MPLRLRFSFYGEEQIDRTLDRLEAVDDMRPAWEVLADRFYRAEARQFASSGAYGSGGWPPLSPKYAAWKARRYPGQPILRRTDDLWKSLTQRGAGGGVLVLEPSFMVIGSSVDYGEHHQKGGGRLPRRRPVELPDEERRQWVKVIQRFIVTGEA